MTADPKGLAERLLKLKDAREGLAKTLSLFSHHQHILLEVADAEIERLSAQPHASGMVMVPSEPTEEMIHAGAMAIDGKYSSNIGVSEAEAERAWKAMLSAVPQAKDNKNDN